MAQDNKVCPYCKKLGHSGFYCPDKPKKEIKRSPIKKPLQASPQSGFNQSSKPFLVENLKKRKPKAKSRSQLIKDLDKVFSTYIRQIKSVNGMAQCVTCGEIKPWQEMQNGHFYTRGRQATRWNEDNCHVQDYRCNVLLKGNYINYTKYMIDRYGRQFVDELEYLSMNGEKISTPVLREKIEYYKSKVL